MADDGEPIGRGQLDRRAADRRAVHGALFAIALFTSALLVNGLLAMLLIEFLQAVGWWDVAAAQPEQAAATETLARMRIRVALASQGTRVLV